MTIQSLVLSALSEAKLLQSELAEACGVSRVTINKYCTGKYPKARKNVIGLRVENTANCIITLVSRGMLPLAENKTKEQRSQAMKKIKAYVASQGQ